jgi:hypothetical protein
MRIKMLNDNDRQSRSSRQLAQQLRDSVQSACGSADAHQGKPEGFGADIVRGSV